jgi:hypothetical protein
MKSLLKAVNENSERSAKCNVVIDIAACGLSVTFGFEREQNCIGSEAHDGRTDWVLNGKGE